MSETLAEALHRLGREGFARRFEAAGDALRCSSCEEIFFPEELLVEGVVHVADVAPGVRTTLYALRCTGCGAKGVWILTDERPEDRALLRRLGSGQALDHDHDHDAGASGPAVGT